MRVSIFCILIFAFECLFLNSLKGQNLDITGSAKISEMEIDNQADNLVVQKEDGTLARRQLSSMPSPPELSDTSRTFANDLEFAKLLCSCNSIPPFLVESALNAGYTGRQLYDGGVDPESLYKGGIRLDSMIAYGETVESLLMNTSATPIDLFNDDIPVTDIYGVKYEGGLIFYIDTLDVYPEFEGLVAADTNQSDATTWGCSGVDITGAEGTAIGDGEQNTFDIIAECNTPGISARLCNELDLNGYSDWFLPSRDELELMYLNLHVIGFGDFDLSWYQSSTEVSNIIYHLRNFSTGLPGAGAKSLVFHVRAARAF